MQTWRASGYLPAADGGGQADLSSFAAPVHAVDPRDAGGMNAMSADFKMP